MGQGVNAESRQLTVGRCPARRFLQVFSQGRDDLGLGQFRQKPFKPLADLPRAPGEMQGEGRPRLGERLLDQSAGGDLRCRQPARQMADAEAGRLGAELGADVGYAQGVLAFEQADAAGVEFLRGVGNDDGAVADQLAARDGAFPGGQRVGRGDGEDEVAAFAERAAGDAAARRHVARGADHQVGAAGGERVPGAAQYLVTEADLRAAADGVEAFQQGVDALDRDDGIDRDPQFGLPAGGDALDAALQFAGGAQQVAAVVEQRAAGRRQRGPPALAQEELGTEIVLQFGNGVRQRRGHAMQRRRGGAEAAVQVDGVEHVQQVEADFHVNLIER